MISYEIELEYNPNLDNVPGTLPWSAKVKSIDGIICQLKGLSIRGLTRIAVETKINELVSLHSAQQENIERLTYILTV